MFQEGKGEGNGYHCLHMLFKMSLGYINVVVAYNLDYLVKF